MAAEFQLPVRIKLPVHQDDAVRADPAASTKGQPWTEEEHLAFLQGLKVFGKGKWRQISRLYLGRRKTPTQVASHAQKYFARLNGITKRKSRFTSLEESVEEVAEQPSALCPASLAMGVLREDTSGQPGSALSDSSYSSGASDGRADRGAAKPCRPTAFKPSPPEQLELGCLEGLLHLKHHASSTGITLPSRHSAFSAARPGVPAAVMA